MIQTMDDAAPIPTAKSALDAAVESMDAHEGFAVLHYKGREIVLMSGERFELWEDAVDAARLREAAADPDPQTISMDELRTKYQIPPGVG